MKRLNIAIVIVALINIVLTAVLLNKMSFFDSLVAKPNEETQNSKGHNSTNNKEEKADKVYSYGCKVCKIGEELVVKGIHVRIQDAYFTKSTEGLTILSDIFEVENGKLTDDDAYLLVYNAEVWCERTDEGLDWFGGAVRNGGSIAPAGELVGTSWLEPLSSKQRDSAHVFINGRYLPQKPEKMNIVIYVDKFSIDNVNEADMYFVINTTGMMFSGLDEPKKQAGFVHLGKLKVK